MAKLNHEPEEIDEGFPEGVYSIKVKYIEIPYTFSTGSTGMRLQFDVWNQDGVGFETWENVVTSSPKAKWKLKELCFALGLDYDDPNLKSEDFEGKEGKADMHRKAGSKWLSINHYLSIDTPSRGNAGTNSVDSPGDSAPF